MHEALSSHIMDGFTAASWGQCGAVQCEKSTSGFQKTYTMRMKSSLMLNQSHTTTSFPADYPCTVPIIITSRTVVLVKCLSSTAF